MINQQWSTVALTIVLLTILINSEISIAVISPSEHLLPPPAPRPLPLTHARPAIPKIQSLNQETSEPPGFMQRIARWFGFGPEDSPQSQQLLPAASFQYNQYQEGPLTAKRQGHHQHQEERTACALCNKYPWVPMFPPTIQIPIANFYKKQQPNKKWSQPEPEASHYHHAHYYPSSSKPPLGHRSNHLRQLSNSRDRYWGQLPPSPPKTGRANRQSFTSPSQQSYFLPTPTPLPNVPFSKTQPFKPIVPITSIQGAESSLVRNTGSSSPVITSTQIPRTTNYHEKIYPKADPDVEIIKSHQLTDFVASVEYPAKYMQSHTIDIPVAATSQQVQQQAQGSTLYTHQPYEQTTPSTPPAYVSHYVTDPTADQQSNTIDYHHNSNQNSVYLTELGSFNFQNTGIFSTPAYPETLESEVPFQSQYGENYSPQQTYTQNYYTDSDNYPSASVHNLTSVQEDNRLDLSETLKGTFLSQKLFNQPRDGGENLLFLPTPLPTTTERAEFVTDISQINPFEGSASIQPQAKIVSVLNQEESQKLFSSQKQQEIQSQWEFKEEQEQLELQRYQEEQENIRQQLQRQQKEQKRDKQRKQEQEREKEWKRQENQKLLEQEEKREREEKEKLQKQQKLDNLLARQKENEQFLIKPDHPTNRDEDRETPKRFLDSPIQYAYKLLNNTGNSSPRPFTRDPGELSLRPISGHPLVPGQLDIPEYYAEPSSTPIHRNSTLDVSETPKDESPISVHSSTDGSGMSPPSPKHTLRQIIIPYTIKNKPRPFQPRPIISKVEDGNRYDTWSQESDVDGHEQQESKLVSTATGAPNTKRTTKYFTKILASNIRELLKREHEKKKNVSSSTFDFVRLQKNIDDWTEQEFTSLSHKASTVSIRGRSKHIPTEYLTTTTPSIRQPKTTTKIENLSTSINNLQVPLPDRGSKRYEYNPIVDNHLPEYFEIKSTTTIQPSSTPSNIDTILSKTNSSRELWHHTKVAISPKTKEKVYVVTPLPIYTPHRTDTPTTKNSRSDELLSVGDFKSPRFLVRPTPSRGLLSTTITSSTTVSPNSLYTPELFGLMGLSSYVPPAPVETFAGHSKVITIVTPSNEINATTIGKTDNQNHRIGDVDTARSKGDFKGLSS